MPPWRDRLSLLIDRVKCPGCGRLVIPAGERGEAACPNCGQELAGFARRRLWFRLFFVGLVLVVLAFLLFAVAAMAGIGAWVVWLLLGLGWLGCLAIAVAIVGIIAAGRHRPPLHPSV